MLEGSFVSTCVEVFESLYNREYHKYYVDSSDEVHRHAQRHTAATDITTVLYDKNMLLLPIVQTLIPLPGLRSLGTLAGPHIHLLVILL